MDLHEMPKCSEHIYSVLQLAEFLSYVIFYLEERTVQKVLTHIK